MTNSAPAPEAPATLLLSEQDLQSMRQGADMAARLWSEDAPLAVSDRAALLAHLTAYQAQVREALRGLLYLPEIIAEMDSKAAYNARYQNMLTRQAAKRLGLEL